MFIWFPGEQNNRVMEGNLLLLWILTCVYQVASKEQRIYVTVFTQNNKDVFQEMHLYISSSRPKPVSVEVMVPFLDSFSPFANLTLESGKRERIDIPSDIQMPTGTLTSNRIVRVISDDDVTVMALNAESSNVDIYQVREVLQLGKEYIIVTPQALSAVAASTVGIVSPYSNVEVKITLPSWFTTLSAVIDDVPVSFSGEFSVTLKENQAFQIQSVDDLSGTHILSAKPVAVLSGVNRTSDVDSMCLDGQISQLLSVDKLGTQYIPFGFPLSDGQDYIHIVTTQPNTDVTINGTTTTINAARDVTRIRINRNEFQFLETSSPSLVAMSTASGKKPIKNGDPSFYNLQPLPVVGLQYTITIPDDRPLVGGSIYLVLMIDDNGVDGILLDDVAIICAEWIPVADTGISACYYRVTDNMAARVLRHSTGKPFTAYLQGFIYCQAYALLLHPYRQDVLHSSVRGDQDERREVQKYEGRRMTSQRMKFLTVEFLSACYSHCLNYKECMGINFSTDVAPGDTNCQLLFTQTDGQVDTGDWAFYSLIPN